MARVSSLGALTGSIAHEVNQPLSGIVTMRPFACARYLQTLPTSTLPAKPRSALFAMANGRLK